MHIRINYSKMERVNKLTCVKKEGEESYKVIRRISYTTTSM